MMHKAIFKTPVGPVRVTSGAKGLLALDFLKGRGTRKGSRSAKSGDGFGKVDQALRRYFSKARPLPKWVAQDMGGTPFQRRVWQALLDIPLGETRTYGEIAEAIGSPGAARAVGSACGANPLPLFIPCHRAVAAGGKLGGFSGGLGIKKKLLAWEGVEVKT
jgi:methylated-DNA-[protein]-cysteine S-methyltransferase